eukprot:Blabericola_migrator_1__13048@NODE_879_length_6197_cov_56_342251_g551_i2_p7_GENE_NODE_879_length_6197_cov_56_342251_g551_i2NODE_879_length_6197_cov_56_342251_g551_i2_p7_ORF_typecomplete_len111_score16_57_NODE_879_length_6197_cov_56_342251_g551_i225982930
MHLGLSFQSFLKLLHLSLSNIRSLTHQVHGVGQGPAFTTMIFCPLGIHSHLLTHKIQSYLPAMLILHSFEVQQPCQASLPTLQVAQIDFWRLVIASVIDALYFGAEPNSS